MTTPSQRQSPATLGLIEIFAGLGSVARGFCEAGAYRTLLLNDIDPLAKKVYSSNIGNDAPYLDMDIRKLRLSSIHKKIGLNNITGVLGCPPCQGFSDAGHRHAFDPRNRLVSSYFRLIDQVAPAFFVMENVERLLQYKRFQAHLEKIKNRYHVWSGVLNAALYGVPQTRTRAIVIGYHRDLDVRPSMPLPTHLGSRKVFDYGSQQYVDPCSKEGLTALGLLGDIRVDWSAELPAYLLEHGKSLSNLVTLDDALGDLPDAGISPPEQTYLHEGSNYSRILRGDNKLVTDHQVWNHRPQTLEMLAGVVEGGVLLGDGIRGRSRKYFSQAYSRLHRDGIARTITTNFHNPGSGRFLHYKQLRCLTIREAARLQGVPDSIRFDVTRTAAERLIGNAFPQPMAQVIGAHVCRQLGHNTFAGKLSND